MGNFLLSIEIFATVLCFAYLAKLVLGRATLWNHLGRHPMYVAGAPMYLAGIPFELSNSGKQCLKKQHVARRFAFA